MSNAPFRIFIGFDPRQPVSFTALVTSIVFTASRPVSITPLVIDTLPIKRMGLTPFTYSRFLVPWLCDYKGHGLFLDSDMIVLRDITQLPSFIKKGEAVAVPQNEMEFERAALLLFNCGHADNRVLTPEYIDDPNVCKAPHLIKRSLGGWTERIGAIPAEFNHLVGYEPANSDPAIIHYTQGIPAFPETRMSEHAEVWHKCANVAMSSRSWIELMGQSVHTKTLPNGQVVPKLHPEAA